MKKQRLCTRNLPSQRYSRAHERFPIRTKINHDPKGLSPQWDYSKFQRNNEQFDNTSCLKKNTFDSLESFFDVKKHLKLHNAYLLASDYYKDNQIRVKSIKETPVEAADIIKFEPFVETLFLQSLPSQTNLESHLFTPNTEENVKDEVKARGRLQTTKSSSAQYYIINMTENEGEAWLRKQKEIEPVNEDAIINERSAATIEDAEDNDENKIKDEGNNMRKREDGNKDEKEIEEDKIDREDKIDGEDEDKNGDKGDIAGESNSRKKVAELKVKNEENGKHVTLADQIQEVKRDVKVISERPELTEKDTLLIQERQNVLMAKAAELEQLTLLKKAAMEEVGRIFEDSLDSSIYYMEEADEDIEKEAESVERDTELPSKILEEDHDLDLQIVVAESHRLPKVIICDHTDDELPKIVIADNERKGREKHLEKLTGKLTESLTMQEKLAQENAQLESGKYKLEETLLEKDTAIDNLERKVCGLQGKIRMIIKENTELKQLVNLSQLVTSPSCRCTSSALSRLSGGGSRTEDRYSVENVSQNIEMRSQNPAVAKTLQGICPAELRDKFAMHGISTKQLKQQLGDVECEVRNMQVELANVQRERQQLEQQRKLLKCTGPCAPCISCPLSPPVCVTPLPNLPLTSTLPGSTVSVVPPTKGIDAYTQQQLRDLREQYARLQEDYKNKLCEVSCMRTDAEKMKQDMRDTKEEKEHIEIKMMDAVERLKLLEAEKEKFEGHKEQLVEQEQNLLVMKQRIRETHDELEDLRSLSQDLSSQLEDYRNKYLQAQQQVEEQRRQLDLMELDNARINENVTFEIGRVKNQFQEKLAELAPLPEILKHSQTKLQEAQQMRLVSEHNCEALSRELLGCKGKIQNLQSELDTLRTERQNEKGHGYDRFEETERKYGELRRENERMKTALARLEEHKMQMQKRVDEKMHENAQLSSMLEQVREDSARQVARTKERCETVRWSMQCQIAEMERQLAQCRATAQAAQRDRDEIRQKMQGQINDLNEAFEHAQGRIRSLQGHVNYLKTSYSNIFVGQGETPASVLPEDIPGMGHTSCSCIY